MSDLVFISFPSEAKAEEVRGKILDLQKDYLIEVGDAVIATKNASGHVKLNQIMHPTAFGAASGAFWGLLIGALFLMPLAGVAVGAASGAIGGALTDVGINDAKMKDAAQARRPGEAGAVPADPQDDHRQGAGLPEGRGRNGGQLLVRPRQGRGAEGRARAARAGAGGGGVAPTPRRPPAPPPPPPPRLRCRGTRHRRRAARARR